MLGRSQQASGPTNVNVRVAGRTFEVDLELLKKHSCYFAKCFHKLPQDALRIPLELQDVKPEVFEALVLFMETGFLDADPFTALDIYEAAMLLGVHRAVKEIKRITLIGSKMERLLVWYRTANKGSSGRERQAALRLVASRFDEVVADERFLRLSVAEVVPLFSCSRLGTSGELSVFVAALRWLNHDYSKRQQYVVQLLKCVRFSLMSREEIVHCFHPPLLSNITRFPSVAFMVLSAFGVVCLQEEGREHLLSRFASQPRTYLCPKQDGQPQLWPLPAPPEGSVAQRRHRAATVLQTWWRVHKARLDLAARRREKLLATGAVDEPQSGALRAWPSDDGAANWLHGTIEAAKSNESVDSDTSAKTSKEPFTPILKVVIKDAESSAKQSAADAGFPALHRSEASLLKLVPPPPPKKEDKVRTPEKAPQAPTTQSSEVFSVNWDEGNVAELGEEPLPAQGAQLPQLLQPQLLQPQRLTPPQTQRPVGATSATIPTTTATTTPAFTAQVLGDLKGTPTLPRATRNFEFSKHAEQGQLKAPFPCDFDREFDMKSFVETVSCAGEVAGIRGRSPSTRTARPRTPPERNSSPTSYRTVQTRSEAAWGFPDEFESKSHGRFWKYDTKSTFTNIYGSFESLDPFSRPHHGNFSLPPSMVKRMGKAEVVTAIEQPSILVTGGLNLDTGISASVVAFDPSFSTLQQCGVLPTPLHHHRTVLVGSDVIVVGGMLESAEGPYVCSRRCYRLNTVTMQWSRVADLKTERAHHGLVYFDGRILAIGGLTLGRKLVSSMEYYDVKRNKWTKMKASLPQPTMAMGVALFRSLVWVAGGVVGSSEDDIACCAAVHCYDPKAKTWTSTAPSLPKPCAYLSLVCAPDGLLSVGGSVSLDQLQAGSVADVWRLTGDQRAWEPLVPLPRPCHSSGAVVFGEAVYVFGGISDSHVLADVLLLQKGRWTLCAHLQASVLGPSVVALPVPGSRCEGAGGGDIANNLAERTGRKDDDLIMWSWHNL